MSYINVTSEIGKLKKVLLHKPSQELENLTPDSLSRLLFDDIPWLRKAQDEHNEFADILTKNGVEVVYLTNLLSEIFNDKSIKENFIEDFIKESTINNVKTVNELRRYLKSIDDINLFINKTMAGITRKEVFGSCSKSLSCFLDNKYDFLCDPMPNLYFMRDPFTSIGNGVTINRMHYEARRRETLYLEYIFNFHNDYKDTEIFYNRNLPYSIEGGDILVLSKKVIAIGISQRTCPDAIEELARNIFYNSNNKDIEIVLAFNIPKIRSYMHLDTIFTQVDVNKFTIHSQIKLPLEVFEIRKVGNDELNISVIKDSLEGILSKYLEVDDIKLINCGGDNQINSSREQWSDGSNTLAIAPGEVVVYERNYITNELLDKNGIKVHEIPSSELSRGRGGPRCMSMPLIRE